MASEDSAGLAPQPMAEKDAPVTPREIVIDLHDGGGVQVFRADAADALIQQLAEAQTNATKKIREQAAELRAYDAAPNLTEDDKRQIAARMLTDFDSVVRAFIDKSAEDKVREQEQRAEQEFRDGEQFVRETPCYFVTPKNAQKLLKWIATQGLKVNVENLRAAYEDLSTSGLLEVRGPGRQAQGVHDESLNEAPPDNDQNEQAPSSLTGLMRRKVVGGLSAKRNAPVMPRRYEREQPHIDPEQMTTAQLHQLALRSVGAAF